jgi:parallel beta-helix repeat protein
VSPCGLRNGCQSLCGADPYLGPVTIRDCRIVNCGADAGAVAVVCPNSLIARNYINGPAALTAIEIAGGATVVNNTIVAARDGIRITGPGSNVIRGNLIQDCTYALRVTDGDPTMQNNTIVGCGIGLYTAIISGGGGGNFGRNIVVDCGTGVDASLAAQKPALGGNDLYGNSRDYVDCATPVDDIHVDPMFCGREVGDYRLCDTSPCVDGLIGAFGVGCTCGVATEATTWGAIKSMFK